MVVGSKVRMMHGFGEGIVTKIQGDQVMVLLNEGLEIPIRQKDLVVISTKQENDQISKADPKEITIQKTVPNRIFFVKEGVYLAGFHYSPTLVDFSIVNFTDFNLSVVVYKLGRPVNQFFNYINVEPKSVKILPIALPIKDSNHLVGLHFQILKYHPMQGDAQPMQEFRLSFSETDWNKIISKVPLIEKDGYLFQLDGELVKINAEELKQSLLTPKAVAPPVVKQKDSTKNLEWREIDLHIESLTKDFGNLTAGQMIDIQMAAFEKGFDRALVEGIGSLIVIHGVGNGVLKSEIHKKLSQNKMIKFFKDGRKEKFGYGATEIQF